MHCIVDTSQLLTVLQEAQRFVATRNLNPTLSGILLRTQEQKLTVVSGNGQSLYQSVLSCEGVEDGAVVIPAGVLVSAIKSLEKGKSTLQKIENDIIVSQGKVSFTLSPLPFEDFPSFPTEPPSHTILFPKDAFFSAVEKVSLAASKDESKPVLTSLLVEMSQPNALVASDGFRLYRLSVDLALDLPDSLLLPAKSVREIAAIAKKSKETVLHGNWYSDSGQIVFQMGETQLQIGVIQEEFPPYRNIIPESTSFSFTVDRELLHQRLQQVMVMAKEVSNIVIFEPAEGELQLQSQASVRGKSSSTLPFLQQDGVIPQFACNGTYLLEFLTTTDVPEICIQGTDSLKPVIATIPGNTDILYLIMPFKLQN